MEVHHLLWSRISLKILPGQLYNSPFHASFLNTPLAAPCNCAGTNYASVVEKRHSECLYSTWRALAGPASDTPPHVSLATFFCSLIFCGHLTEGKGKGMYCTPTSTSVLKQHALLSWMIKVESIDVVGSCMLVCPEEDEGGNSATML